MLSQLVVNHLLKPSFPPCLLLVITEAGVANVLLFFNTFPVMTLWNYARGGLNFDGEIDRDASAIKLISAKGAQKKRKALSLSLSPLRWGAH